MPFSKILDAQKNSIPQYKVELKEAKKTIFVKPFLVEDYKRLLTINSNDPDELKQNAMNLIRNCATGIGVEDLTINDFIYLLVSIAEVSLGQSVQGEITCSKCNAKIPVEITSTDLKYDNIANKEYIVKLDSGIILELKPLTIGEMEALEKNNADDAIIESIMLSIKSVVYDDEVYEKDDIQEDELREFVRMLTKDDVEKINKITNSMPVVKMERDITCPACGQVNHVVLGGIDFLDFF